MTSNPSSDCRPEGVIRRGFTRAFHQGIKLPEIPKNDLISGMTVNSLNTFVPEGVLRNRDWSRVRKWNRVGTRELLGPSGTGTVNFHREHKVGSLAYDGHNIPPYRHV